MPMANRHRGEVELQSGSDTYTLRLSANAIVAAEDLFGLTILQIADAMSNRQETRMATLRGVLWASLQEFHPDIDLQGAGEIITTIGVPATFDAIGRAMQAAFPTENTARPRKARTGSTG
jgi:hypothetical protein